VVKGTNKKQKPGHMVKMKLLNVKIYYMQYNETTFGEIMRMLLKDF